MDVRKKRSQDGAGPRRQELEETLAALRDQEAVVKRTIELLQAGAVGPKSQAGDGAAAAGGQPRPTAEPRDYEQRLRQVTEEQRRRAKAFWSEVRKLLTNLRANKQVLAVFGLPVRSTPWGGVPANWDLYCQSVSDPMDLGTVRSMLGDDETKRQYTSPEEVKRDIQLIVANARAFNKNPSDPVLPVAASLEQMFARKWQEGNFETRWRLEVARRHAENEVRALSAACCPCAGARCPGTAPSALLASVHRPRRVLRHARGTSGRVERHARGVARPECVTAGRSVRLLHRSMAAATTRRMRCACAAVLSVVAVLRCTKGRPGAQWGRHQRASSLCAGARRPETGCTRHGGGQDPLL